MNPAADSQARPPRTPGPAADDVLAYLARRHSVGPKHMVAPAPTAEEWARAAVLAQRAPDHGGLRPYRFAVVADEQRQHLAELFAAGAAARGCDAETVEQARERAGNGPGLAAMIARLRPDVAAVPPIEQWLCVGGALMNVLNALHLMGYGAKTLSGPSVRDPVIQAAFCAPDETLVAWIAVGTPARAAHPREPADDPTIVAPWQPLSRPVTREAPPSLPSPCDPRHPAPTTPPRRTHHAGR